METDRTQPGMSGPHPTIAQLRSQSADKHIHEHIAQCSMCQSVVAADGDDTPIPLDLPKGLVSENAFKWPADPIARGGMAQIFAGEDRRLGRQVIIKTPRDDENLPAGMTEMFQRRVSAEARVLAKLQHPSIVTLYELGKATVGWPFLVEERVDGTSLRDRLDELQEQEEADHKPRTRERLELLSNLVAIAEALAYAHERRVVHRDVTPNNIILGKRGEATLIDWGIARDLDAPSTGNEASIHDGGVDPSKSGRMVTISAGTPPYIPLEQSQGRKADPNFDVYSFGITLYEVVSGRTPFIWKYATSPGGRTAQIDAFMAWLQSDDDIAPAMPKDKELSGIIARSMHRDASKRFTAEELVRALKQYLTGDLVFSHRYSLTGRLARWARQHKAVTVAALSLVAFAIGGALVWAQLQRQAKEEAELRTVAASAKVDASEKARLADEANREADAAKARADEAVRQGKDAQALKAEADRKRRAADESRKAAESAATQAKGTADEAVKRFQQAMKEKDEANAARDAANAGREQAERDREAARAAELAAQKDRDAAKAARQAADAERDAAKQSASLAETARNAAVQAREAADREREAARAAQQAAEKERDAAIAARANVEKERDEARRKAAELEQKLKDAQQQPAPSGPPGPPPPPPGP
ncbi:MAG TPA: protein kinase [Kofleriaceae bacterium]|nr:protein kinase [Kofleriaceae bacterium]